MVTRSGALLSPFTVNATTATLKTLFTRAEAWGMRFDRKPEWKRFWLKEPQERVRELVGDEGERLAAATRDDHAPFFAFAKVSGMRQSECLLRWSEVDWTARQIRKRGKGDKWITVPITPTIRAILWPLQGHHPEHVFTYVVQRTTQDGVIRGQRYPVTISSVTHEWIRLREAAGVTGFRFHDLRHDFASKLLRETGNLKLVQRALNHSDISTTVRYAHVLEGEVADAMERIASPNKSTLSRAR